MKRTRALLLLVLLTGLWLLPVAQGAQRDEDPSEAMVRKIARDLRCAVCQNQSVYESNSDLAKDMLEIIRDKVRAGEQEATIRDYFFQRYGDYIYLEPTGKGTNKILWLAPFLGVLIGALGLWAAITRWRRPSKEEEATVPQAVKERIQKELDRVQE